MCNKKKRSFSLTINWLTCAHFRIGRGLLELFKLLVQIFMLFLIGACGNEWSFGSACLNQFRHPSKNFVEPLILTHLLSNQKNIASLGRD